jgi:hypothetical protein
VRSGSMRSICSAPVVGDHLRVLGLAKIGFPNE